MLKKYYPWQCLPSSEELPDSDDKPVDNELQDLMPNLLKQILAQLWQDRMDWFFGVDMGIYYGPDEPAIVPDGFLSLGVQRIADNEQGIRYPTPEERADQAEQRLEQERQRAERLAARLRELNIDPDSI